VGCAGLAELVDHLHTRSIQEAWMLPDDPTDRSRTTN
jgi:hypothetical protein